MNGSRTANAIDAYIREVVEVLCVDEPWSSVLESVEVELEDAGTVGPTFCDEYVSECVESNGSSLAAGLVDGMNGFIRGQVEEGLEEGVVSLATREELGGWCDGNWEAEAGWKSEVDDFAEVANNADATRVA